MTNPTPDALVERLRESASASAPDFGLAGTPSHTRAVHAWGAGRFHAARQEMLQAASTLAAMQERIETLEKALIEEREEVLWNAYHTGHEKGGRWTHMFMSDGEWLAREVGLDPRAGDYDAEYIKAAIPVAAKKHPALRAALGRGE